MKYFKEYLRVLNESYITEASGPIDASSIKKLIPQIEEILTDLSDIPWSSVHPEKRVPAWQIRPIPFSRRHSTGHGTEVTPKYKLVLDKDLLNYRKLSSSDYIDHPIKVFKALGAKPHNRSDIYRVKSEAWQIGNVIFEKLNAAEYSIFTISKKSSSPIETRDT